MDRRIKSTVHTRYTNIQRFLTKESLKLEYTKYDEMQPQPDVCGSKCFKNTLKWSRDQLLEFHVVLKLVPGRWSRKIKVFLTQFGTNIWK